MHSTSRETGITTQGPPCSGAILVAIAFVSLAMPLAEASLSVPLAPQQLMALSTTPGNATYDPPLPPGTATRDVTWVSYLPPEGTVVSLHGGSGEPPMQIGSNVTMLSANASVQRDEWLRIDMLLEGVFLDAAAPSVNWTSLEGMLLGGFQLPRVRLESLGDAFTCTLVPPPVPIGTSGVACSAVVHCFAGSCGSMSINSTYSSRAAPLAPGQALLTLHAGLPGSVSGRHSGALRAHMEGGQYVHIASGHHHICAIAAGGSLWCWGNGELGALGVGTSFDAAFPVQVLGDNWYGAVATSPMHVVDVNCGWSFTCAVLDDGSLWCWGDGADGQTAQGSMAALYRPARVTTAPWSSSPGKLRVVQIQCGDRFACALLEDGTIWCWGHGSDGQLGHDSTALAQASPVRVNATWRNGAMQLRAIEIVCGASHACAILEDGSLWCWGRGVNGELGDGSSNGALAPVPVNANEWGAGGARIKLVQVAAGSGHSCAVPEDGSLWCWGSGNMGRTGLGTTGLSLHPQRVLPNDWGNEPGQVKVTQLATARVHTCAVLEDGSLWCCGKRYYLGQNAAADSLVPTQTNAGVWGPDPGQMRIVAVAAAGFFSCALAAEGQAHCFGDGQYGQLGNGGFLYGALPVPASEAQYVMHVPGARDEHLLKTFALSIAGPARPALPPCLLLPVSPALADVTTGGIPPSCAQPNATQSWTDVLAAVSPVVQGKWLNHPDLTAPFHTLSTHLQHASNATLVNHSDVYIAAVRSCSDGSGGQVWETHQYMVSLGDGGLRMANGGQCSVGVGCTLWSLCAGLCLGGESCGVLGPVGGAIGSVNASSLLYVAVGS